MSDNTDEDYLQKCKRPIDYQQCYATIRNDVGQTKFFFQIRIKPNAILQTQRLTENPIHQCEKLKESFHRIREAQFHSSNWFQTLRKT